jgi:hypothetical protein
MKYWLIIVTIALALLGWLKPTPTPRWAIASASLLLVCSGILQLRIARAERRSKAISAHAGVLKSTKQTLLAPDQKIYPKLEIGDTGTIFLFTGPQGQPLFSVFEDTHLTMEMEDGQLKVSTVIRDKGGRIVAELLKNEWKVNAAAAYDRNYSEDAIEVRDSSGDVVLQLRFVGDRVQFQGKFFNNAGQAFGIGKIKGPDGRESGAIELTGHAHPHLQLQITPIFRYPSDRHLGEFA